MAQDIRQELIRLFTSALPASIMLYTLSMALYSIFFSLIMNCESMPACIYVVDRWVHFPPCKEYIRYLDHAEYSIRILPLRSTRLTRTTLIEIQVPLLSRDTHAEKA